MSEVLAKIGAHYVKPAFTEMKVGDTVRVYTRIKEGEKERTQYFEGLVIRRRGGIGSTASFTVRRIASGVGVERTFPLHSPLIERVVIQRAAKTRRATLYTMRGLTGKAARLTEIPVDRAAREVEHPDIKKYGIKVKVEDAASEKELEEEVEQSTKEEAAEVAKEAKEQKEAAETKSPESKADTASSDVPEKQAAQDNPEPEQVDTKAKQADQQKKAKDKSDDKADTKDKQSDNAPADDTSDKAPKAKDQAKDSDKS